MSSAFAIRKLLAIWITIMISLVVVFLDLPAWISWMKFLPMLLVTYYWGYTEVEYFGPGSAWLLGLIIDMVGDFHLGENALPMLLAVFLLGKLKRKIVFLGLIDQTLVILGVVTAHYLLIIIMQIFAKEGFFWWEIIRNILAGVIIWPIIRHVLTIYRRKFVL